MLIWVGLKVWFCTACGSSRNLVCRVPCNHCCLSEKNAWRGIPSSKPLLEHLVWWKDTSWLEESFKLAICWKWQSCYRKRHRPSADAVILPVICIYLLQLSGLPIPFSILQLRSPGSPAYSQCFLHLFNKLTYYFSSSFNLFLIINI